MVKRMYKSFKKAQGKDDGATPVIAKEDVIGISHPILDLQENTGNQRVLAQTQRCSLFPQRCPTGGACHLCPASEMNSIQNFIQPKLEVGQPADRYEQEADRVAGRIMSMPGTQGQQQPDEAEKPNQTKEGNGRSLKATPTLATQVRSFFGDGQPLPHSVRGFFEPRFGYDFAKVRMHTDSDAVATAQAVGSRALTLGWSIAFAPGQYRPETQTGRHLIAHELTHVVQQQGQNSLEGTSSHIRPSGDTGKHLANGMPQTITDMHSAEAITELGYPIIQRDLARPPRGRGAALKVLKPSEVQDAINYNISRFSDPYSIRVIRDVLGLEPVPAIVDNELIQSVVQWQAARHLKQDGKVGHFTTRSFYFELVAAREYRDAIFLLMDSYDLPGSLLLHNIRVGIGPLFCGASGRDYGMVKGGRHCRPVGAPIKIFFCRHHIPSNVADYNYFVRTVGHELIHVPHCATGPRNLDVMQFESYYWEVCATGRMPHLPSAERVRLANDALTHFASIPSALRTHGRIDMRNRLNNLVANGGVGPCT